MTDTLTLKLTRAEKAAAKRLAAQFELDNTGKGKSPYSDDDWLFDKIDEDTQLLANAVLRAIKKGGAK